MSNTSKIILVTIIAGLILLGLGYAAIQNITLNIAGTATANTDDANFNVRFTRVVEVSDSTLITATKTDDTNAKIVVSGLTEKGQSVTATYEILNDSADLSSDLNVATTNSNTEYFYISSELAKSSIKAKETTTVLVTVELLKTPIGDPVDTNIGVSLIGIPVQPGEEGSSGLANNFSENPEPITLATVTNDNIGDYIDLRNNVIKTTSTQDDWRILYKDDTAVYAVLADYLPNSTNYAANAGLKTKGEYRVYSNTSKEDLEGALKNSENWNHLANGINGAEVLGTMETTAVMNSYKEKGYGNINADYSKSWYDDVIDLTVEDVDLYVSNTDIVDDCLGIWTVSLTESSIFNYYIYHTGRVQTNSVEDVYPNSYYDNPYMAIRPMVKLPLDTTVAKVGDVWTILLEETNGRTVAGVERNESIETVQTTLASVSNNNIGEFIDLGNSYVGGETSSDDWRILYKDGNTIYAMLTEHLPTSYVSDNIGLTKVKDSTYEILGSSGTAIANGLSNTTEWAFLTNGITGAQALGGPPAQILMNSYNVKHGTNLNYTTKPSLIRSHFYNQPIRMHADQYWTSTSAGDGSSSAWTMSNALYWSTFNCYSTGVGVRPVVMLPTTTSCTYTDGLWVVE